MRGPNGRNRAFWTRCGLGVAAGLALAALVLTGCSSPSPPPVEAVQLGLTDRPTLDRLLETHRGRVVLIDFWATWCPPCVQLFPHSVDLARRYADRGLSVVCVSLDDPKDDAAVRSFLAAQGATATENFLARNGSGSETAAEFQIEGGAIPFLKVYDRQGRLRTTVTGADLPKIEHAVLELLDEK
ncbi:MAG: TlpA disulfide reductase family protein [Thermoguttaceae bacterium]|jgi:thiol-disulfide isomerase/thioredoxin